MAKDRSLGLTLASIAFGDETKDEKHGERAASGPHADEAVTGDRSQQRVTRAYDRIAWIYDVYTSPMEWAGLSKRRERLLSRARGAVLEVGAGTGRSFRYYPSGVHVTATDAAPRMVQRARRRAAAAQVPIDVREADVQHQRWGCCEHTSRRLRLQPSVGPDFLTAS